MILHHFVVVETAITEMAKHYLIVSAD
jgi:hypothetical protein